MAIPIERSRGTKKDKGACREKSKRPRPPMDTGRCAIHQAGEDGVRSSWKSACMGQMGKESLDSLLKA